MSVEERTSTAQRLIPARERYVARCMSPALLVARAAGARIGDVVGSWFLTLSGEIRWRGVLEEALGDAGVDRA